MTISSSTRKAGPYAGNASTVSFPFGFKVFAATDLVVVTSDGTTETPLVLNTDYSVTLNPDQNANPGGTVTYPITGSPLGVGFMLTITSGVSELQQTSLPNQGGWYPKVVEDALDRAVVLIQQLREVANRALVFPKSDPALTTQIPSAAARANKALIFDANGNVAVSPDNYVNQTAATAASAAAAANSASAAATSASAAAASTTQANTSAGSATQSASQALYYAQHGTGFAAGTAYDLGSVADPLTLFPTDLGTVS